MHSVRVVLAAGLAGVGALAHRLAALNPAEADWDQHWRRTGSDQEHPVPASAYAPLAVATSEAHCARKTCGETRCTRRLDAKWVAFS